MKLIKLNLFSFILMASFFGASLQAPQAMAKPAPGVSGALSLVPGLGQVANGDPWEGAAWFTVSVGLFFSGNYYLNQVGWDLWFYNMYDAYRDAGPKNVTKYNVAANYVAAFNPLNLIDPIGAPVVGVAAVAGWRRQYPALRNFRKPLMYGFVGLGEEGLFRGFLFPGFSDVMSSKWLGAITSSALFALVHASGGRENLNPVPLASRFIFGMVMCWQVNRNSFDLRNSIFAHTWWDVLVDPQEGHKVQGVSFNLAF